MGARSNFFDRLGHVELVLSDPCVTDGQLGDTIKNAKARVLRNGLAVVMFAILEDFIRARTSEILGGVGNLGLTFKDLPARLQDSATTGLLKTLSFRLALCEESQKRKFLQDHAAKIASSGAATFEVSQIALVHGGSNIRKADVTDALTNFQISGGWQAMSQIAARLNFGALPLADAFEAIASRRHFAAHEAAAAVPLPDLVAAVTQCRAIASAYDCLISRAYWLLHSRDPNMLAGKEIQAKDCGIARVVNASNRWKFFASGRKVATMTNQDKGVVATRARQHAIRSGEFLVFEDITQRPTSWDCPSVI